MFREEVRKKGHTLPLREQKINSKVAYAFRTKCKRDFQRKLQGNDFDKWFEGLFGHPDNPDVSSQTFAFLAIKLGYVFTTDVEEAVEELYNFNTQELDAYVKQNKQNNQDDDKPRESLFGKTRKSSVIEEDDDDDEDENDEEIEDDDNDNDDEEIEDDEE